MSTMTVQAVRTLQLGHLEVTILEVSSEGCLLGDYVQVLGQAGRAQVLVRECGLLVVGTTDNFNPGVGSVLALHP